MTDKGNGDVPSPEAVDVGYVLASVVEALCQDVAPAMLESRLVPTLQQVLLEEQQIVPQILDSISDPSHQKERPRWGFRFVGPDGVVAMTITHKRLADVPDLQHGAWYAAALGLLTSPVARAVLRLHGYQIQFVEPKAQPQIVI